MYFRIFGLGLGLGYLALHVSGLGRGLDTSGLDNIPGYVAVYPTSWHSEERWMFSAASVCVSVCLSTRLLLNE